MDNVTLKKVQMIQLEMVKYIHRICEQNNLSYIMLGGTLLGAVRHKGFIPWDDDLDIGMPREDYDKLITLLTEKSDPAYFIQTYETEKHGITPFAKLRKNGTTYLQKGTEGIDFHVGVFIDIFPLDFIPAPLEKKNRRRQLRLREYNFAIKRKEGYIVERTGIKRLKSLPSFVLSFLPKSVLISWIDRIAGSCEKTDWYASLFSNYTVDKVYYSREDLESRMLMEFEDTQLYAPKDWEGLLTRMFKKYMELPPEDKRDSGHNVVKIEL